MPHVRVSGVIYIYMCGLQGNKVDGGKKTISDFVSNGVVLGNKSSRLFLLRNLSGIVGAPKSHLLRYFFVSSFWKRKKICDACYLLYREALTLCKTTICKTRSVEVSDRSKEAGEFQGKLFLFV